MCQFRQYKEFFEKLKKENRVNSYTIGSLMMEILEDRDMLFDYMDTPTVSVDLIDFLVEKRSKMRGDGKTEDQIDQKIKEMIFRGSGVIFNHQLKIWKILENEITISVDFLEASYKNDFRFEDYYQEIYQEDEEVESSK